MQWSEEVTSQVRDLKHIDADQILLQKLMGFVDLTSLNASDTESSIAFLSEKAQNALGHVAAVCTYPQFVSMLASQFAGTKIRVATVANFPEGTGSLAGVLVTINGAIADGAQEVDVVFPYPRFLAGEKDYAQEFVTACKAACGPAVTLKIILETGVYQNEDQIATASEIALWGGADFIKTSTGKVTQGATLQAAATMLLKIKHLQPSLRRTIGLKVSGGIQTVAQAIQYLELADHIIGIGSVTSSTFRIGASRLVDEMLRASPSR